jgi:hypothetical protein
VPGRDAVVVLGRNDLGTGFQVGSRVLGRTVRINGVEFTVIGVAPASIHGYEPVRAVRLLRAADDVAACHRRPRTGSLEARDARNLTLKGRLKPASAGEGASELTAIASICSASIRKPTRIARC